MAALSLSALGVATIARADPSSPPQPLDLGSVQCEPGELLARFEGATKRVNTLAFQRGYLIENEHGTGITRVWDISDPRRPHQVREYDEGWSGHHAFGGVGEVLGWNWAGHHQVDLAGLPDLVAARADRRFVRPTEPERVVYYPYSFGGMPASYGYRQIGAFSVHDERRDARELSRVEVLSQVGFEGRINLIGNLLIVRGDNEQDAGVAVYDVSDPHHPEVLGVLRQTRDGQPIGKSYDSMPVWRHYIIMAQSGDTVASGGGGRAVDFIDFSDPRRLRHVLRADYSGNIRYAQFQDDRMFVGEALVDLTRPGFPEVLTFPGGGGEYNLPIGNLLVTAGQERDHTIRIWCTSAEPDRRPPTVAFHSPPAGARSVSRHGRVGVLIHETLDLRTLRPENFRIMPVGGEPVAVDVSWTDHDVINITPRQPLAPDTRYAFVMPAGGVKDVAGNALAETFRFEFATGAPTNRPPHIESLVVDRPSVLTGEPVTVSVRASDGDGWPLVFEYHWGDGSIDTSSAPSATHVYRQLGFHDVRVMVRDAAGATAQRASAVLVEAPDVSPGISSRSAAIDRARRVAWVANPDNDRVVGVDLDRAPPTPAPTEGRYRVRNVGSGLCLTPVAPADGGRRLVEQRACDHTLDQAWALRRVDGEIELRNAASGRRLAAGSTNHARAHEADDSTEGGRWIARGPSTAELELRLADSPSLCLDISGGSLDPGAAAQSYTCVPNPAQTFVLEAVRARRVVEVPADPRSVALDPAGGVWVVSHDAATVSVISPVDGAIVETIRLPLGSGPVGIVVEPAGRWAYVSAMLEGRIYRIDARARRVVDSLAVGPWPRALALTRDGQTLLATRFISDDSGGTIYRVDTRAFEQVGSVRLEPDRRTRDSSTTGRGLPNYLMAITIAPDGRTAWVGMKKDNVFRGMARDGRPLTFESTLRSAIAIIDLEAGRERLEARMDLDNHELVSDIAFSPGGALAYITHQGNREVSAWDVGRGQVIDRIEVGQAPIAAIVDPEDGAVYAHAFLDRALSVVTVFSEAASTVGRFELKETVPLVHDERMSPEVLRGKQLFYTAHDPRISRDGYISCAACHLDGGHDGRTWDFTGRGEGLRNTISLRGRRGTGHGPLHWSANFDEVQDFEGDIRHAFGGTGLAPPGSLAHPLGASMRGASTELDALAAYVSSLAAFGVSPHRGADGQLTPAAAAGRMLFEELGCAGCHGGEDFTDSASGRRHDVGTLRFTSGGRLGGLLDGLDTPTLRGLWRTAPYLHDGSAATVEAVLERSGHGVASALDDDARALLGAFLLSIDDLEPPVTTSPTSIVLPTPE